ncbi:MAG: TRAM domain-containing protein [Candidatus Omnitrophota bacterium]|jgi:tRNA/tmRNA/rRNA uracil-C5-methylase (TrmA/RlmC/RlmD family)
MDLEIKIEKLVFGGDGLGFSNGKACFVEGALPGETVLASVLTEKRNYCKAELLKILTMSPHRTDPPCPYTGTCGGCQYQHLTYDEEKKWKELQVRESFLQALRVDPAVFVPLEAADRPYGYRNSITLHKTTRNHRIAQRLAFIGRDNKTAVPVDRCLLADPALANIFLQKYFIGEREKNRTFKLAGDGRIVTSESQQAYGVQVGDQSFVTGSLCFFQNNLDVTALAAAKIRSWVEAAAPLRFIDLYCGVGTFSLLCAKEVPEIACFEENPHGIAALKENIRSLGRGEPHEAGFLCVHGQVEKTFPPFIRQQPKPGTVIFMDPPRQGIAGSLADLLAKENVCETLVYLACDLAILLRDLKIILSNERYEIKSVAPFDMFPKTKHIEIAVLLKRV